MNCKKCGLEISQDSQYCSNCGKKVKHREKITFKTVVWALLTIVSFFAVTFALIYFLSINNVLGVIQNFFNPTERVVEGLSDYPEEDVEQPPAPTETLKIEIPELKEAVVTKTGFGYTEHYDKEKLFYINPKTKNIYVNMNYADVSEQARVVSEKRAKSIFVRDELIYAVTDDEILRIDYLNGDEETVLHTDKIGDFYVDDEFIFYSRPNTAFTGDLYRINISGDNCILIAENIFNFDINQNSRSIFYSTIVQKDDYDEKNNYSKFIRLREPDENTVKYLTIFTCDLAGESVYKFAEKPVDSALNIFTTRFVFLDDRIAFSVSHYDSIIFCIVENNRDYYALLDSENDNLKDYLIYNENIYYTKYEKDRAYVYSLYAYNYATGESVKITETIPYTSIKIYDGIIYILLDNRYVITCNIDGTSSKGFFDFSEQGQELGQLISLDNENIYFKNAVLKHDKSNIVYVSKDSGQTISYDYAAPKEYKSGYPVNAAYFELLTKSDYLGRNKAFVLQDINADGIAELFIADNSEVSSNYYEGLLNTKIYTFQDDSIVELEYDNEYRFTQTTDFLFNRFDDELISYTYDGGSFEINYNSIEDDKLIAEPFLKQESMSEYYSYQDGERKEITYDEFVALRDEFSQGYFAYLRKYDINITNIIQCLYFSVQ